MLLHGNEAIFLLKNREEIRRKIMKVVRAFKDYRKRRRILKAIRVLDRWRKKDAAHPMIRIR